MKPFSTLLGGARQEAQSGRAHGVWQTRRSGLTCEGEDGRTGRESSSHESGTWGAGSVGHLHARLCHWAVGPQLPGLVRVEATLSGLTTAASLGHWFGN